MTIRITGGEARGRGIPSPPVKGVRPTASKMRQALFNILGARTKGARFLDVFAGTGLIGLEALSRGASSLTAVEQNKSLALNIEICAHKLGYAAEVLAFDFRRGLSSLEGRKFDIIFADPPYRTEFGQEVLLLAGQNDLLDEHGVVVVEHPDKYKLECQGLSLKLIDRRQYGQSAFSFFSPALMQ